jgi:hypothetical protein
VKPIHLNLAARPYRDYRPVYAVVVAMSLVAAFLMLYNVDTYYRYIHETQNTRAKIARLEEQTRRERELGRSVDQRLKGVDVKLLDAQTRFINARLAERAFSWSALLDELETVLADDVRVLDITPQFTPETRAISLRMNFESKTPDGLIETLNRMHADPQFSNPFPGTQSMNDQGSYTFDIAVAYMPPGTLANQQVVSR